MRRAGGCPSRCRWLPTGIGLEHLSIESRFSSSVNSVDKDDESYDQIRNRVFSIQLDYMFGSK